LKRKEKKKKEKKEKKEKRKSKKEKYLPKINNFSCSTKKPKENNTN